MSVGGQYIISKMLEDLEYYVLDWSKGESGRFFADRMNELDALKNAGFISKSFVLDFRDDRESLDEEDPDEYESPIEGFRES